MKNKTKFFVKILSLIIIQVSVINNGIVFGYYPDLIMVYTIYSAQKWGRIYGGTVGLTLGFLLDILLSPNIGIKALNYMLIGYIIGIISEFIFEESIWVAMTYTMIGTFIYRITQYVVFFFLSYKVSFNSIFLGLFKTETLLNIILVLLFMKHIFFIEINQIKNFLIKRKSLNDF